MGNNVYLIAESVACFSTFFFFYFKSSIHVERIKEEKSRPWPAFNGQTLLRVNGEEIHSAVFFPGEVDLSASQDFLCHTYRWKISIHSEEKQCDLFFFTHFLSEASSLGFKIESGIFLGSIKTHTQSQEVSVSPAAKATFKCGRSP